MVRLGHRGSGVVLTARDLQRGERDERGERDKATCVNRTGGFFAVAKGGEICYTTSVASEMGL